jgi:hypothetical protein
VIDPKALLADLKGQVKALEADLRLYGVTDNTTAAELEREWQAARDAQRTAASYEMWRGDRVTQVAVAWVLGTVFVRFCEDNDLIEYPVIAGPGDRVAVARERQGKFFEESPELTDRDWIVEGFNALSVSPVVAGLFEWHNPMWSILPSHEAVKALLAFWRDQDANAQIVHDFTDETWNTRFLGDLYQDLSEYAKKTYALLQTPEFVEDFILKYTLDPAVKEFGLEPEPPYGHTDLPRRLRVIDPACGSGHFLLGAFARLLAAWQDQSGDTDKWVIIARALESVHGVDKNPFAAAIARFRLMLAAMQAGEVKRLTAKVDFPLNIAVGDSLLHGRGASGIQTELELFGERDTYTYRTEDIDDYINSVDMLGVGSYHVVVANPPYITVHEKQENTNYRRAYMSCYREYSLAVPFAERLFQLATHGGQDGFSAGYVGQITANSFMRREFGKKLIEEFFPTVELTHVIDTSGARLPGFGTPPVTLIGRRRWPRQGSTLRAVLRVRAEPGQPEDPANGLVWRAIVDQVDLPGTESEWVSVVDMPRDRLAKHPWSLSGGGAESLKDLLESAAGKLVDFIHEIGFGAVTREDDVYMIGAGALHRMQIPATHQRAIVEGDKVRNWSATDAVLSLWPYDPDSLVASLDSNSYQATWPYRTILRSRVAYSLTQVERGLSWYEYSMFFERRYRIPLSISFAAIATHNHFILDRGGKVFNRSAPVIKLPESATEDHHLVLLSVLNSSTGCFWVKQVCQPKGGSGIGRGIQDEPWEERYDCSGARIEQFPLPAELPLEFGRELDGLAQKLAEVEPSAVCAEGVPAQKRLDAARGEHERIRGRMIALQEELDWDVYRRYGLLDHTEAAELVAKRFSVPELKLGERAFEIVLARRVEAGEVETQWFIRHGSTPITDIPEMWPQDYRDVVAKRIETIEQRRDIGLIERPECKRRWQSEPWEKKEQTALRNWLLDRCEDRDLWYVTDHQGNQQPRPMTVNRLADRLRGDADVVAVARLFSGPDADLADVLKAIIADEHVPFLSQLRYSGTGLLRRLLWEKTWNQQRQEDQTGQRLEIDMPPKYKKEDFLRTSYWNQRGKLDVPKERFISYPRGGLDSDDSLLLGWAGWDHRERAHALITLIEERASNDGWDAEKLTPILAGLLEVLPWVRQWHDEIAPAFGASPAREYDMYLMSQREKYGLTEDDLRAWTPPAVRRGRRRGGGE